MRILSSRYQLVTLTTPIISMAMRNCLREQVVQSSRSHLRPALAAGFSVHARAACIPKILPGTLSTMKKKGQKLAMVTAYDYPTSCIAHGVPFNATNEPALLGNSLGRSGETEEDSLACLPDLLLVGDSVGQVVLGHQSTSTVTLQHMLHHTSAVTAARRHSGVRKLPLVVTDLPFGSFRDAAHAVDAAIQSVQVAGAGAVKIEGAGRCAERVASVTEQGVAVMGHIGLLPQTAEAAQGGFKVQGKTAPSAAQLVSDAIALEEAGACSLVLELVPWQLADVVAHAVNIPVIGIGAGAGADGQVLVWHDFMGLNADHVPRFVQQYAAMGSGMQAALGQFVRDVRGGVFPGQHHSTGAKQATLQGLSEQFTAAMQASVGQDARQGALERALSRTGELLVAGAEGGTAGASSAPWKHSPAKAKPRSLIIPLDTLGSSAAAEPPVDGVAGGLRVAVVGSGAIAQLMVATLGQQGGVRCVLVPSREERFHALQQRGSLSVQLQGGVPEGGGGAGGVQLAAPGAAVGDVDVVLLTCKGQYTDRVMESVVRPLLQSSSGLPLLVSAQNGLAPLQATLAAAQAHGCAAAVCVHSHGALLLGDGRVQHTGVGAAALGFIGSEPPSTTAEALGGCLAELLHTCGLASSPSIAPAKDIHTMVAKKFAVNCALNAATVLLNAPNGSLLGLGTAGRALLASAAQEAILAAKEHAGDVVGSADWEALLGGSSSARDAFAAAGGWEVARRTAANTSSTLADVQRGVPTEGLNDWVAQRLPQGTDSTNGALAAAVRCIGALRTPAAEQ